MRYPDRLDMSPGFKSKMVHTPLGPLCIWVQIHHVRISSSYTTGEEEKENN